MHHHLLPIGTHLIDEIQRLVNHRFFNEKRDRQIKQTEHQAIFPVCHQEIRMAFSNAPHPVPNRHAMIGPAGMNDSPAILARHNGLVIHPAAHKEARIYLDHTVTAFPSTSSLSTSTSPEISFGNSRSRVLGRLAFFVVKTSIFENVGLTYCSNNETTVCGGLSILIPYISSFVTDLNIA